MASTSDFDENVVEDLVMQAFDRLRLTMAKATYVNVAAVFFLVGLQSILCLYGLAVYLETPKEKKKGRFPYIVISITILVASSFSTALNGFFTFNMVKAMSDREAILGDWEGAFNEGRLEGAKGLSKVTIALPILWITVGDAVLLFRCYIIWRNKLWVTVLPAVMFLAGIALRIVNFTDQVDKNYNLITGLTTLVPVIFNIITTLLIVGRLAKWMRDIQKVLRSKKFPVYRGALAILIESALPLAVFGLCSGVTSIVKYRTEHQYATPVFGGPGQETLEEKAALVDLGAMQYAVDMTFQMLYNAAAVLSPQLLIFRVTTGRSFTHSSQVTASTFSGPIIFSDDANVKRQPKKASSVPYGGRYERVEGDDVHSRDYDESNMTTTETEEKMTSK
ncbi:hypothetical protein FA15DRAFT_756792 [Coprinopsis marcescibilis]|uniref:Transmembrane protein n=1 Tax=Coprinopsis marcescibilis TaxID=230819 RepID=A0A5C3L727_COPMA|nr:hypothetical protein FA15DRAFT_756792 [Coprinopsis marcescibilis]